MRRVRRVIRDRQRRSFGDRLAGLEHQVDRATLARSQARAAGVGENVRVALIYTIGRDRAKQRVVDAFERAYLTDLLKRHAGNITRAAQEAGLTRYHLRELLKRHGLVGGTTEE